MSSLSRKVNDRRRGTGERYQAALQHVRGDCGRCRKGTPCAGCLVEPCWICRPECPKRFGTPGTMIPGRGPDRKCQFDDIVEGGKACTYCGGVWPPKVSLMNHPAVRFLLYDEIRAKGEPISAVVTTRTGRDPMEFHRLLAEAGKGILPKNGIPGFRIGVEANKGMPDGSPITVTISDGVKTYDKAEGIVIHDRDIENPCCDIEIAPDHACVGRPCERCGR